MSDKISDGDKALARKRFHIMMMVDGGEMTATDAAKEMGVSRTTFYEWQNAATAAALTALTNGQPGRVKLSPEVLRIRELEKELEKIRYSLEKSEILSELKSKVIEIREGQLAERKKKRD